MKNGFKTLMLAGVALAALALAPIAPAFAWSNSSTSGNSGTMGVSGTGYTGGTFGGSTQAGPGGGMGNQVSGLSVVQNSGSTVAGSGLCGCNPTITGSQYGNLNAGGFSTTVTIGNAGGMGGYDGIGGNTSLYNGSISFYNTQAQNGHGWHHH